METPTWLPPIAALVISFFTSMAGISGAVLLLPLQISVFGLAGPAVSATNLVFNLVATPAGIYRYWRERRILWPLALLVVAGTTPGVIVGGFIRVTYLPDPKRFKVFAGLVLLWLGARLLLDVWRARARVEPPPSAEGWQVSAVEFTWRHLLFEFRQQRYRCTSAGVLTLSLIVGLIGGIYGIGGAAIIAPFLITIHGLPVHIIAGATLMGTLVTSVVGVGFYQLVAPAYQARGVPVAPNWALGLLFGIGGMAGMYLGARVQRFVPATYLKILLALVLSGTALSYLGGYLVR
jgi:uncharacterized membrane protein YfcA